MGSTPNKYSLTGVLQHRYEYHTVIDLFLHKNSRHWKSHYNLIFSLSNPDPLFLSLTSFDLMTQARYSFSGSLSQSDGLNAWNFQCEYWRILIFCEWLQLVLFWTNTGTNWGITVPVGISYGNRSSFSIKRKFHYNLIFSHSNPGPLFLSFTSFDLMTQVRVRTLSLEAYRNLLK